MLRAIRLNHPAKGLNLTAQRTLYSSVLDSDIHVTKSGKTVVSSGSGGRSSRTGYTATVFGASGFIGRYLTSKLARHGTITVVPFRDDMKKRFLKVCGDLGVVNFIEFDLRNVESINESVRHSDIVFNLIGSDYETKNFSYRDVHVEGARRVAQACVDNNVARLVHVSSHNADVNSKSAFFRSKGEGEAVVREVFPEATIVRPGPVFGREDKLLSTCSDRFRMFNANGNRELMRPVHVLDVAKGLEKIGYDDSTAGQLFELYGPTEYSKAEIRAMVQAVTLYPYKNIQLPERLLKLWTEALQLVWWPMRTPDAVDREFINHTIDETAKTFTDLGIQPEYLEDLVFRYVYFLRMPAHMRDLPPTKRQLKERRELVHVFD